MVLPVAFGLIAARLVWRASPTWIGRGVAALGILAGIWLATNHHLIEGQSPWPWIAALIVAGLVGMPIFALLGGIALFAFLVEGGRPIVLLIKAHEELTTSAGARRDPAVHAGRVPVRGRQVVRTAAARASRALRLGAGRHRGGCGRAVRVFHAVHRRIGRHDPRARRPPAAGAAQEGYRERFSLGLLTASGSLGLLFPPSLPLILYGIVAQRSRSRICSSAGCCPVAHARPARGCWACARAMRSGAQARAVPLRRGGRRGLGSEVGADAAGRRARARSAGGYATPSRRRRSRRCTRSSCSGSSIATCRRGKDVIRVTSDCIALVGGVLVILAVAVGLTNYLVNAQVPSRSSTGRRRTSSRSGCSCWR